MADEKLVIDVIARDRASREFDRVGDAAVKAGRDFDKASDGAGKLQAEIDQTTVNLRELGREFDKTGDKSLLKDIGRERRTLAGLTKLRKEMAGLAGDTAKVGKFTLSGLTDAVEALPQQLKGALIIGAVGGATAAAPFVAAALTGAIGGAIGSGVIAAGIAGAAQSPQVKAAWQELAQGTESVFAEFSRPFVTPTIEAIGILRDALGDVSEDVAAIGHDAARFLEPLARGVGGLIAQMLPGLRELVRSAGPIFDMFEDELPNVGRAVSDFFDSLSDGAEGGADGLRALLRIAEVTLKLIGEELEFLSNAMEGAAFWSEKLGGAMDLMLNDEHTAKIKGAGGALGDVERASDGVTVALKSQNQILRELADSYDAAFNQIKSVEQANIDYQRALDELTESVRENGQTLDAGTEAGRANRESLIRLAEAAVETRAANLRNGMAASHAEAQFQSQRAELIRLAQQFGASRGEAERLIATLLGIPNIRRTVTVQFVQEGVVPGGARGVIFAQAKGGIVAAAQGMITSSPTVLFGERQTGQEAFIPKMGISRQRGMALASQAASWHGASVVPNERMGGGGGMGPVTLDFSGLRGGDELLAQWLHRNLSAGRIQLKVSGSRVVVG